jgi:ABC-type multidrug transport system fused ATPase/permease subunit
LELPDEIQNARLNRNVETTSDLVEKYQRRIVCQRLRDLDALLHTAAKAGRLLIHSAGWDFGFFEQFLRAAPNVPDIQAAGHDQLLTDVASRRVSEVQTIARIPMHHAEQVIPDVAFALPTNGQHVGSAIIDGSEVRFPRGRLEIVIEHLDEGTFARSALTDKTEDFARVSIEGDSPRRIFERARSAAFFPHGHRGAYCFVLRRPSSAGVEAACRQFRSLHDVRGHLDPAHLLTRTRDQADAAGLRFGWSAPGTLRPTTEDCVAGAPGYASWIAKSRRWVIFERVGVRLGGVDALRELEIAVPSGSTIAILGRTGSGKSTAVRLLPRLIDPTNGRLVVDGRDVRELQLTELRSLIGMVPQETFLFSATVAENIAFGVPSATRAQIERAAEIAGLSSDLAVFPKGFDTVVGERGVMVSGDGSNEWPSRVRRSEIRAF